MNLRRSAPFVLAPLAAFGGLATGSRWIALGGAVLAWAALLLASRSCSLWKKPIHVGLLATLIVAMADSLLSRGAFFVHLRRELPSSAISIGVEAVRGVLLTTCLLIYTTGRTRVGFVVATLVSATAAFGFGYAFERIGTANRLWVWNELTIPKAEWGGVPAFAPLAWGVAFLFVGYFLAETKWKTIPGFSVVLSGLRCGAGYMASFMVCWAMFLRFYGKAAAF